MIHSNPLDRKPIFNFKIYPESCPRCSGDVALDIDREFNAQILRCYSCSWFFLEKTDV